MGKWTDSEGCSSSLFQLRQFRVVLGLCAFGTAYYIAYLYGMSFSEASAASFWFPDTVLLCALLLSRPRNWWIYVTGSLLIRLFSPASHGTPFWFLLATAGIDSAKGLLTAAALRIFARNSFRLESLQEFGLFCFFAVLLAPAASAFGGAALRHGLGYDYWITWRQWFMGDAVAQLVVTPALLCWLFAFREGVRMPPPNRRLEAGLLAAGLIATGYAAFSTDISGMDSLTSRAYVVSPLLFWAAIRFTMEGASGAVAILSFFAVRAAVHGQGQFPGNAPAERVLNLQEFLVFSSVPLYLVAILVQQRENAERSSRESEERFRIMANSAPVLIWMSGRDTLRDFFNRGWLDFTGRIMEQELGTGWAESVHAEDVRRCMEIHNSSCEARQPFEIEYRLRRFDGEYRWILDRGVPRHDFNGDFVGYIGSAIDLTDRKRADEARQDLIHASRLAVVGEFTAMVAHELNQPLNAILNNTEAIKLLLDVQVAPLDEVRTILADIREDDLRASEAIRRIRALVSKREMDMQFLDINQMVSEVVRLARGDALARGVQLYNDCRGALPAVRGDVVHLQQVVLNLIVNGMDAMKDIPETDRHLFVCTASDGEGLIEVAVKDAGRGIPPENLSRVFDAFFTTKREGMGIGLSMARSIVQLHGGHLWAENNREGGGTTFRFTLPAAVADSTRQTTTRQRPECVVEGMKCVKYPEVPGSTPLIPKSQVAIGESVMRPIPHTDRGEIAID